MRLYRVTLTNGSWAEIEHEGPVNILIKELRKRPAIKDTHGRMVMTDHIVTVSLRGRYNRR